MSIYLFRTKRTDDPRVISASNPIVAAQIGAAAVTGVKVAATAYRVLGFTGSNGAGACTVTGAKVGDVVAGIVNMTDGGTITSSFEAIVTVINQIQQTAVTDLSAKKCFAVLVARS